MLITLAFQLVATLSAVSAQSGQTVGDMGDPAKIVFQGNEHFTAERIRKALICAPGFLLASHPDAPLDEYPPALAEEIRSGYETLGFPQAEVKASLETGRQQILISIKEGPRYRNGDIHVAGAKRIPAATLIKKLQEKPEHFSHADELISERLASYSGSSGSSSTNAIWTKGDDASLGAATHNSLAKQTQVILTQLGYGQAKLKVAQVQNRVNRTVDLNITILEEGPTGKVGDIEITGLKKNTREEVLKYLGLKPGMKFDRALLAKLETQLWQSGRFTSFKVTPEDQTNSSGNLVKLTIELHEYAAMPALGEKLSRGAEAMVRLANWLSGPECAREDVVADVAESEKYGGGMMRLIFSPQGLLIAEMAGTNADTSPLRYGAFISATAAGLFDFSSKMKLTTPPVLSNVTLLAYVRVLASDNSGTNTESPFGITFGGGFRPQDDPKPKFDFDRFFIPTAFARLPYESGRVAQFAGGEMLVTNEDLRLRVEEKTGRLRGMTIYQSNSIFGEVHIAPGACEQKEKEILQRSAGEHNAYDTGQPLNSIISFAFQEALRNDFLREHLTSQTPLEQIKRVSNALEQILAERPFAPLDDMVARWSDTDSNEDFVVPMDIYGSEHPLNTFMAAIGGVAFLYVNDLFPRNSWPWTVTREAVFVVDGNAKYTGAELKRLMDSGEMGPVGCDAIAHLITKMDPSMAKAVAIRGLLHLEKDDFRKDWELALKHDCVAKQVCENLARALGKVKEADVNALAASLRPEDGEFLKQSAKALRERGEKSVADALAPSLDDYWDKRLREKVHDDLKKLTEVAITAATSQ